MKFFLVLFTLVSSLHTQYEPFPHKMILLEPWSDLIVSDSSQSVSISTFYVNNLVPDDDKRIFE